MQISMHELAKWSPMTPSHSTLPLLAIVQPHSLHSSGSLCILSAKTHLLSFSHPPGLCLRHLLAKDGFLYGASGSQPQQYKTWETLNKYQSVDFITNTNFNLWELGSDTCSFKSAQAVVQPRLRTTTLPCLFPIALRNWSNQTRIPQLTAPRQSSFMHILCLPPVTVINTCLTPGSSPMHLISQLSPTQRHHCGFSHLPIHQIVLINLQTHTTFHIKTVCLTPLLPLTVILNLRSLQKSAAI